LGEEIGIQKVAASLGDLERDGRRGKYKLKKRTDWGVEERECQF